MHLIARAPSYFNDRARGNALGCFREKVCFATRHRSTCYNPRVYHTLSTPLHRPTVDHFRFDCGDQDCEDIWSSLTNNL